MRRASWIAVVTGGIGLFACGTLIAFCALTLTSGTRYDATVEHVADTYDDVCADVRVTYAHGRSGSIVCEDPGVEVGDTIPVVISPAGDLDSVEGYGMFLFLGVLAAFFCLFIVAIGGILLIVQSPRTRPDPSITAA